MVLWLVSDRRLIGRWRSDRERTLAEWPFRPDATEEQRERVGRIFGKLELTYGRWRCRSVFEGDSNVGWYGVLAKDSSIVMIVGWRRGVLLDWERNLSHIHFTDEHYWITLGESNTREFFRRVG